MRYLFGAFFLKSPVLSAMRPDRQLERSTIECREHTVSTLALQEWANLRMWLDGMKIVSVGEIHSFLSITTCTDKLKWPRSLQVQQFSLKWFSRTTRTTWRSWVFYSASAYWWSQCIGRQDRLCCYCGLCRPCSVCVCYKSIFVLNLLLPSRCPSNAVRIRTSLIWKRKNRMGLVRGVSRRNRW